MEKKFSELAIDEPSASGLHELKKFAAACLRLCKPGISFFIGLSTATAYLARPAAGDADWRIQLVLFISSFLSSSGAAAFNQFYESDLDRLMRRTRTRPIPAGIVSPAFALFWSLSLLLLGLGSAYLLAGAFAALYLAAGAFAYIVLYTVLTKRRTAWNVPVGGLCGAFAAMAGASGPNGEISLAGWGLTLALYFWSAPHFWSLALVAQDEYRRAGVPMAPAVIGDFRTTLLILAHCLVLPGLSFFFREDGAAIFWTVLGAGLLFNVFAIGLVLAAFRAPDSRLQNAGAEILRNRAKKSFFFSLIYLPLVYLGFWLRVIPAAA